MSFRRLLTALTLSATVLIGGAATASAATYTWTGSESSSNWTDPDNWDGGDEYPGADDSTTDSAIIVGEEPDGDDVLIVNVPSVTLVNLTVESAFAANESVPQQINGTGVLTITGELTITGGNFGVIGVDDIDEPSNNVTAVASPRFVLTETATGSIDIDYDNGEAVHVPTFGAGYMDIADGAELTIRKMITSSFFDTLDEDDELIRNKFTIYNAGTLRGFESGDTTVELRHVDVDNSGTIATSSDSTFAATFSSEVIMREGSGFTGSGAFASDWALDIRTDLALPAGGLYSKVGIDPATDESNGYTGRVQLNGHTLNGPGTAYLRGRVDGPATINAQLELGEDGNGGDISTPLGQPFVVNGASHVRSLIALSGLVENHGVMTFEETFEPIENDEVSVGFFMDYFNVNSAFRNASDGTLTVEESATGRLDLPSITNQGALNVESEASLTGGDGRSMTTSGSMTVFGFVNDLDVALTDGTLSGNTNFGIEGTLNATGGTINVNDDRFRIGTLVLGQDATLKTTLALDEGYYTGYVVGTNATLAGALQIDVTNTDLPENVATPFGTMKPVRSTNSVVGAFDLVDTVGADISPRFFYAEYPVDGEDLRFIELVEYQGAAALDKTALTAGDTVTVTGSGYPANAPVTIFYSGGNFGGAIDTATASGTGAVAKTVTIPATFATGTLQVGIAVDGTFARFSQALAVAAKPAPVVITTPNPNPNPDTDGDGLVDTSDCAPTDKTKPARGPGVVDTNCDGVNDLLVPVKFVGKGNTADKVTGSNKNDTIKTGGGNDVVKSGAGNDVVDGGAGNDNLDGGAGNDKLTGGAGKDKMSGGAGNDTINAKDGKPGDTVNCGTGKDVVKADPKDKVAKNCEKVARR